MTVVAPSQVNEFLGPLSVRRLRGVGPAGERVLREMGIATVDELRRVSLDRLIERFGHWGRTLYAFARGEDAREVRTGHERKSLSTEHTFANDLRDPDEIDGILRDMSREIAGGLRSRELSACTVTVKARYPDFTTVTRSHTLPAPTSDAGGIAACAVDLIRTTEAFGRSVRLLGVGVSNLVPARFEQRALFDSACTADGERS